MVTERKLYHVLGLNKASVAGASNWQEPRLECEAKTILMQSLSHHRVGFGSCSKSNEKPPREFI